MNLLYKIIILNIDINYYYINILYNYIIFLLKKLVILSCIKIKIFIIIYFSLTPTKNLNYQLKITDFSL